MSIMFSFLLVVAWAELESSQRQATAAAAIATTEALVAKQEEPTTEAKQQLAAEMEELAEGWVRHLGELQEPFTAGSLVVAAAVAGIVVRVAVAAAEAEAVMEKAMLRSSVGPSFTFAAAVTIVDMSAVAAV